MKKTIKYIAISFTTVIILVAFAGMYKFNYLASQEGYDVDGNKIKWVETIGIITENVQMDDGSFAYTLSYDVIGGDARNMDGQLIQGPLSQHIFGLEKRAIEGQKIKLRYNKKEPIFYELLEEVEFSNEAISD